MISSDQILNLVESMIEYEKASYGNMAVISIPEYASVVVATIRVFKLVHYHISVVGSTLFNTILRGGCIVRDRKCRSIIITTRDRRDFCSLSFIQSRNHVC